MCWFEGPLTAFDTETTGVDVERDRIVSAALVVQSAAGAQPITTRWLVNPGCRCRRGRRRYTV
ncbi:DNA polymerase III subunit epsilon [Streptomyces albireticuli]|uniref:DNA polymerase III subunit epsilon n=1 Tax=Streptomyces albireticuli TaxID=1940 RepID=A0A1Z2L9V6_9ACTN|nr:DNA polymerase III subunit epsilon [Streptomyces albireticuli]